MSDVIWAAGRIVNPPAREAVCEPVVTVTVTAPAAAVELTAICAVAVVGLVTVTGPAWPCAAPPTETPGPKLATVVPCMKLVYCPVIDTERLSPTLPELGISDVIWAAGRIVNPPASEAVWPPVMTVTVTGPMAAVELIPT